MIVCWRRRRQWPNRSRYRIIHHWKFMRRENKTIRTFPWNSPVNWQTELVSVSPCHSVGTRPLTSQYRTSCTWQMKTKTAAAAAANRILWLLSIGGDERRCRENRTNPISIDWIIVCAVGSVHWPLWYDRVDELSLWARAWSHTHK